jgi:hypothetical protein
VGLYKRRHKIENIFRKLKHWHRHPTLGAKGGPGSKLHAAMIAVPTLSFLTHLLSPHVHPLLLPLLFKLMSLDPSQELKNFSDTGEIV